MKLLELVIVYIVASAPFWISASDWSDGTELKAALEGGGTLAFIAAVVTIYRTWKRQSEKERNSGSNSEQV